MSIKFYCQLVPVLREYFVKIVVVSFSMIDKINLVIYKWIFKSLANLVIRVLRI